METAFFEIDCSWPEDSAALPMLAGLPSIVDVKVYAAKLLENQARLDCLNDSFELHCMLVSDQEIQELNARTRARDMPTDVLSFPLLPFENGPGSSLFRSLEKKNSSLVDTINWQAFDMLPANAIEALALGDIVISYETCIKQANDIGHSPRDEFWRLFVHGMLHLFGYDHETNSADEARMQAREDELFMILDQSN